MTDPALIERITRSLAYMLRHQPQEFDLEVDSLGYADVDEVVRALNERLGEPVTRDNVEDAVASGDRPRYELRGDQIRALYGHSIHVEPGEPAKPPEMLYVGVAARDVDRAIKNGLAGGRRRFLHLARTVEDARESGRRSGEEYAVLAVRALEAWEEGVNFYDRQALFLAESIPTRFISLIERNHDGTFAPRRAHEPRERRMPRDRGDRFERGGRDRHEREPRESAYEPAPVTHASEESERMPDYERAPVAEREIDRPADRGVDRGSVDRGNDRLERAPRDDRGRDDRGRGGRRRHRDRRDDREVPAHAVHADDRRPPRDEPRRDDLRRDEPRRDEPRRDEARRDDSRRDAPRHEPRSSEPRGFEPRERRHDRFDRPDRGGRSDRHERREPDRRDRPQGQPPHGHPSIRPAAERPAVERAAPERAPATFPRDPDADAGGFGLGIFEPEARREKRPAPPPAPPRPAPVERAPEPAKQDNDTPFGAGI